MLYVLKHKRKKIFLVFTVFSHVRCAQLTQARTVELWVRERAHTGLKLLLLVSFQYLDYQKFLYNKMSEIILNLIIFTFFLAGRSNLQHVFAFITFPTR